MLTRDEIEFARLPDHAAGLAAGGPLWTPSAGPVPAPGRRAASTDLELETDLNTGLGSELSAQLDLERLGFEIAGADATGVIEWAARRFGEGLVMSTSFGIHSAAFLHLVTRVVPGIPVIWIDTGYLPQDTLRFAEQLSEALKLNLKSYRSPTSPAEMEALHGRLWERDDVEALNLYDRIRTLEPMQRALREQASTAWLAGLRADQTQLRETLPRLGRQSGRIKLLPILDWTTRDTHEYLRANDLPYHPLFEQGYATVGDWHSSRAITAEDDHERDSRFRGMKQECGIHLLDTPGVPESVISSEL